MCAPLTVPAVAVHNLRINPQPAVQNDAPEPMVCVLRANLQAAALVVHDSRHMLLTPKATV